MVRLRPTVDLMSAVCYKSPGIHERHNRATIFLGAIAMKRRFLVASLVILTVTALTGWTVLGRQPQSATAKPTQVSKDQMDRWILGKELSNWGRWGKDDQLGAMNLVTDAKRKQAISAIF